MSGTKVCYSYRKTYFEENHTTKLQKKKKKEHEPDIVKYGVWVAKTF